MQMHPLVPPMTNLIRRTILTLLLVAGTTVMLGCGDDDPPTGLGPDNSGDDAPPSFPFDPTIPPVPMPVGPQPMTQARTDTGSVVSQGLTPRPLQLTLVGGFQQTLISDPDDRCVKNDNADGNINCTSMLYGPEKAQFLRWMRETTGDSSIVSYDSLACRHTVEILRPAQNEGSIVTQRTDECLTFHLVDLVRPVEIRHVRYWQNVGSRVLGPGTDYSITLTWTEGIETRNGFAYNSTQGFSTLDEGTWSECTTETLKVTIGVTLGIPDVVSFGGEGETSVAEEDCYTGRSARETSTSLSETFDESRTVTTSTTKSETTSVTGAEGANRVYTVWQLVDRYIYVTPDGTEIEATDYTLLDAGYTEGIGATDLPLLTEGEHYLGEDGSFFFSDGVTPRATAAWKPGAVSWPHDGTLDNHTNFFVQQTVDFPLAASSGVEPPTSKLTVIRLGFGE